MFPVADDPFNVVKLAGKRIRSVPVETAHEAVLAANDPDGHGVVAVIAAERELAKTVAAYEGTWGLIWRRQPLRDLVAMAYFMPGHE